MSVSWRHMLAAAGVGVVAAGGVAVAGPPNGCHSCSPPPPPPPPPSHGCCQTPNNLIVNVPGVSVAAANVSVGATSTVVASAGVSTTLSSGVVVSGGGSAQSFVYGSGGSGFYSTPAVPQSAVTGLTVMSNAYCIDRIIEDLQVRPVQALCLDDTNTPHPASRLDDSANVDANYDGEVYRCVAGTHMQVTYGKLVDGKPSFDAGETVSCLKGESLWHSKDGALACKTQIPERNCNERSLLRKYGPGVKLVQVASKRNVCEPTDRASGKTANATRIPRAIAAGDLVLDGGVGQGF